MDHMFYKSVVIATPYLGVLSHSHIEPISNFSYQQLTYYRKIYNDFFPYDRHIIEIVERLPNPLYRIKKNIFLNDRMIT